MSVDNLSGNATLLPLLRNFIYFYPLRLYLFLGICYANFAPNKIDRFKKV